MSSLSRVRASDRLLADQVRDQLLSAVHSGALEVGAKIPNEQQLCDTFGVSRVTVREAVRSLVEAGYLNRVHGSGTYVAFRPSARHSLERNLSYSTMIEEAGMRPTRRLISVDRGQASDEDANRLGIESGDPVIRVERVRHADEHPVISSVDTLPSEMLGDVSDEALAGSLYDLLQARGHKIAHAEATLLPVVANAQQAAILGVTPRSPLLHIAQVDWLTDGRAAMYSREWHVPGVFQLTLLRRPSRDDT